MGRWFRRRDGEVPPGDGLGGTPPAAEPTPAATPSEVRARMLHPAYTPEQVAATTRAVTDDTIFLLTANNPSTFRLYQERLLEVAHHPARAYSAMSALSTFAMRLIVAPPEPGTPPETVIQDWRAFLDGLAAQVVADAEKHDR